jgi:hypothetical protein
MYSSSLGEMSGAGWLLLCSWVASGRTLKGVGQFPLCLQLAVQSLHPSGAQKTEGVGLSLLTIQGTSVSETLQQCAAYSSPGCFLQHQNLIPKRLVGTLSPKTAGVSVTLLPLAAPKVAT